jgi:anti-sigma B factor antagonist
VEIAVSEAGEVKVLRIDGKLDTKTSPDAQVLFTELIEQGATKIVVNFEKLVYISSSGLRVLLSAAKQLKSNSGELRVCSLNEVVQEVFEISGFNTILAITESELEALEDF